MEILYKVINWYTAHFPFPHKGLKFFRVFLRKFKLEKKSYRKKLPGSLYMELSPEDHIQQQLFWYGYYEKNAIQLWGRFTEPGSIVIDIGANIGYYSLVAAKKASKEKVIAFEPVTLFREKINSNLLLNDLANVNIQPYVIGNEKGKCKIFIAGKDNTGMSGLKPQENFSGEIEEADMISLDEWLALNQSPAVNLIKIDTEGAELKVLQGMTKTLQKDNPIIFIEVIATLLSLFENTPEEIYAFLLRFHYTAYEIVKKNTLRPAPFGKEDYTLVFLPGNFESPSWLTILP